MGNVKRQTKRNRLSLFFLNFAKLGIDIAKLSFASLVLGTIIKGDIPQSTLLTAGIIFSTVAATFSIFLITMLEEK